MSKRGVGSPKGKLGNGNEREERDKEELEICGPNDQENDIRQHKNIEEEKENRTLV